MLQKAKCLKILPKIQRPNVSIIWDQWSV